jgi:hypothetical protein
MEPAPSNRRKASRPARSESAEARAERLRRIRQMIDDGTYDTPERFEAAFSRMLSRVFD